MKMPLLSLSKSQLDNLFEHYLILDENLAIAGCSYNIEDKINSCIGNQFDTYFTIKGPFTDKVTFENILTFSAKTVEIVVKNQAIRLKGKFEFFEDSKTLLFVGREIFSEYNDDINIDEPRERLTIFSQIVEKNIHSVILTDLQDRILWVNQSFTNLTHYTLEESLKKRPETLLGGRETNQDTLNYLNNQVAESKSFSGELINYKKDGTAYWGRITGQTIFNQTNQPIGFFSFIEDITIQKQIEERADLAEREFRAALEKISHFWECDLGTGEITMSESDRQFWGFDNTPTDEPLDWWKAVHEDDVNKLRKNLDDYKLGFLDSHNEEYRFVSSTGEVKHVLDQGVVVRRDESGKPLKLIGTHTDVTSIRETEESLQRALNQFKSVSDHLPIVLYEYEYRNDGSEGMRYISPAIQRVFGLNPHEFWNKKSITEVDYTRITRKLQHSRRTLKPFYDECEISTPNKGPRCYAISSVYSYTTKTDAIVFTGFMLDITERKAIEDSIKVNEEKYRNILASMELGMLEVDGFGLINYVNNCFCSMSGYKELELIGRKAETIFPKYFQENPDSQVKGKLRAYEFETKNKEKELRWWMVSMAVKYNEKAERIGATGIFLDITANKAQEIELIQARVIAEQLAQTKEIFLANMSHEMRTPMHAIMSMTSQLAKTKLDSNQNFYLETVKKASKGLLVLINDILDLSKIDAGKLNLEEIGFDLVSEIQDALKVVSHKAELKGLNLYQHFIKGSIAPILVGDPHRLKQVLMNLLANAIKFTEKGSVDLTCTVIMDDLESQLIEISVIDTGIGMHGEFLSRIFEKFSQSDNSVNRKFGGTGLGMSISKSLVEQMGGEIKVESKRHSGTKVTLTIGFKKGLETSIPEKPQTSFHTDFLEGKKILVTDDNDLNRLVASVLLLNYGATVLVAENGEEALAMIGQNTFDFILMDVQMPVLNGYETTKILRDQGNKTPIIALTASAIAGEKEKCFAAGMDDYITKPIDEDQFLNMLEKWIEKPLKEEDATRINEETIDLYSLKSIEEISKGKNEFVLKITNLFCDQMPAMVQEMKMAYENNNLLEMGSVAHKLKSNIDLLHISSIQRVIRNIEELGNEQINDDSLVKYIAFVAETIAKTVNALKKDHPSIN